MLVYFVNTEPAVVSLDLQQVIDRSVKIRQLSMDGSQAAAVTFMVNQTQSVCLHSLNLTSLRLIGSINVTCGEDVSVTLRLSNVSYDSEPNESVTRMSAKGKNVKMEIQSSTLNDVYVHYKVRKNSNFTLNSSTVSGSAPTDNSVPLSSRPGRAKLATGILAQFEESNAQHYITVTNSIFENLYQRHQDLTLPSAALAVNDPNSDSAFKIEIKNTTFRNNERAIDLAVRGELTAAIESCNFLDNFGDGSGGAIRMMSYLDKGFLGIGKVFSAHILIQDSLFENNLALDSQVLTEADLYYATRQSGTGGAIFAFLEVPSQLPRDGLLEINDCTFIHNTASVRGGTIYVNPELSLTISNTQVTNTETTTHPNFGEMIYSLSNTSITNTTLTAVTAVSSTAILLYQASDTGNYRLFLENFLMTCPQGYTTEKLVTPSLKGTRAGFETLQLYCKSCPADTYSLNTSKVSINLENVVLNNSVVCTKCPYGAACTNGIQNTDGFWGRSYDEVSGDQAGSVTMFACPQDYCKQGTNSRIKVDFCAENRDGVLCGSCEEGYSESLFGLDCINNNSCSLGNWWVLFLMALYGLGYVCFFMFQPDWERFLLWLSKQVKRQMSKGENVEEESVLLDRNKVADSDVSQAGYLQIFMYFIQTSALLKVDIVVEDDEVYKSVHRPESILPRFLVDGVKKIFSVDLGFIQAQTCLFPDMNLVKKTAFSMAFTAYLFGILIVMYILTGCCCVFLPPKKRRNIGHLSNTIRILLTFLSLFLYTYQSIAENAFLLLNCVNVDGNRVLFHDGNEKCFQNWQYGVIALVLIYIVPFFTVLLFGIKLLERKEIGLLFFFASCLFPLFFAIPTVLYYFKIIKTKKETDENRSNSGSQNETTEENWCCGDVADIRTEVVDAITGPYKYDIFGGICYEGVLNFRRMVMVVLFTFITDLLIRHMALAAASLIILVVHIKAQPFKHKWSNVLETVSLVLLLVISGTNLIKATFESTQVVPRGTNYLVVVMFEWIEAICFGMLPFLIILVAILAMGIKKGSMFMQTSKKNSIGKKLNGTTTKVKRHQHPLISHSVVNYSRNHQLPVFLDDSLQRNPKSNIHRHWLPSYIMPDSHGTDYNFSNSRALHDLDYQDYRGQNSNKRAHKLMRSNQNFETYETGRPNYSPPSSGELQTHSIQHQHKKLLRS